MMYQAGDRVMRSDVTGTSIPAYRDMRGTIVQARGPSSYYVQWDCDPKVDPRDCFRLPFFFDYQIKLADNETGVNNVSKV